jgi:tRNA(Ile)-lysidine synthase
MPILSRIRRTIDQYALAAPGARAVVALSGGADSVALLRLMRELEAEGILTLAGAAHLNHRLRGDAADADEAFCAALAAGLDVPFVAERVDVAALARAQKRSVEDAARVARYAFLERAAVSLRADVIAVAHTKEDQAETFLLRLLRGAGTRGLGAIRPRAGRVIRPLIEIERETLREYLRGLGQTFREDATNADVAIPRNRVRHELLPYLRTHFSPAATDVLARAAALAREDEEFLHAEAIKLAARTVLSDVAVRIDVAGLRRAPRALSSRVVHAALSRLAGSKPIHFDHVDRVLALLDDDAADGRAISLPGQDAVRVGQEIVLRTAKLSRRSGAAARADIGHRTSDIGPRTSFAVSLSIPGEVRLGSQAVGAEMMEGPAAQARRPIKWQGRGAEVGVAAGTLALPLAVRSRRPGDKFHPLGAPGRRKLQDFLVDRKVSREDRDTVPLVVDGRDRIVWVVGQAVAEDFRVTDPSQGVILLKVRHLGGVG